MNRGDGKGRGRTKNSNRRLGDRIWDSEGRQYHRIIGDTYFATHDSLLKFMSEGETIVGLQRDHTAVQWLSADSPRLPLETLKTSNSMQIDGRSFGPTLWQGPNGMRLLLLEEIH